MQASWQVVVTSAGQRTEAPEHVAWETAVLPTHMAGRHTVVASAKASVGQLADAPLQTSATSQAPAEARQTVETAKASAGQPADVPVHDSATSQSPAEARHSVAEGTKASAGQAAELPLQTSAMSQGPAEGRHSVPEERTAQSPSTAAPAAMLQAWQSAWLLPPHAEAQQTWSTQAPEAHCASTRQATPSGKGFTKCHVSEKAPK